MAEFSFDAWGRRRNPTDWGYNLSGQPELFAGRGFTGHEDLPWFNLVNMNGRLYDPLVGRFLSVDPYIQDPGFTQEYNRYSYCLNNPLRYTDPSGYKKAPVKEDAFIMDYANYWNRRMLHGGGGGGGGLNSFFRSSGVGRNTSSWLSNDYFVKSAYREGSYSSFVTSIETAMWNKGMTITGSGFHFQSVNPIEPKRIKRNSSSSTNIDYFYIFVVN